MKKVSRNQVMTSHHRSLPCVYMLVHSKQPSRSHFPVVDNGRPRLAVFADEEAFVIANGFKVCSSLTFTSLETVEIVEVGPELVSAVLPGEGGCLNSNVSGHTMFH